MRRSKEASVAGVEDMRGRMIGEMTKSRCGERHGEEQSRVKGREMGGIIRKLKKYGRGPTD